MTHENVLRGQVEKPLTRELSLYYQMTKPTVSLLVVVTAIPAMLLANGGWPSAFLIFATAFGTLLAAGSASVFNHVLETDIDIEMNRTRNRPVATGRIQKRDAFLFAALLGTAAVLLLYLATTPLAALVALAAIGFYVLIYTVCLKRYTTQNIVIGGAAGAVGPLIGWAAVTGSIEWPAWIMFAIIFLWTPPHFWALALKYKKEYAAAEVPMLPVVHGDEFTRRQIFLYTLTLLPPVLALAFANNVGPIYLAMAMPASLYFVWQAAKLYRSRENYSALSVFHFSCLYLFIIFGGLTIDTAIAVF